jgi:hypothetical protein
VQKGENSRAAQKNEEAKEAEEEEEKPEEEEKARRRRKIQSGGKVKIITVAAQKPRRDLEPERSTHFFGQPTPKPRLSKRRSNCNTKPKSKNRDGKTGGKNRGAKGAEELRVHNFGIELAHGSVAPAHDALFIRGGFTQVKLLAAFGDADGVARTRERSQVRAHLSELRPFQLLRDLGQDAIGLVVESFGFLFGLLPLAEFGRDGAFAFGERGHRCESP